jgi:hypothetical protein
MKVVVQNYYGFITRDGHLFKEPQSDIGHNLLKPWNEIYKQGKERGIDFYTPDQLGGMPHLPKERADVCILMDMPSAPVPPAKKFIQILYEPEIILPGNWESELHDKVDLVLTWSDPHVDGKKFIKSGFTADFKGLDHLDISRETFTLRKLCTLINSAKMMNHPSSLYPLRIDAIRWFERNHPQDFDLYGKGWPADQFPSYKGALDNKLEKLKQYNFAIAYENCNNAPGYISEKILDCFLAGVVPVYYGAPNVLNHIPKECFLDLRDYPTYEELYQRMKDMQYVEYMDYMHAIAKWIASEQSQVFHESFAVNQILTLVEAM